jgi:hypothetical protein
MPDDIKLKMSLAELLNHTRRNGEAAMIEIPPDIMGTTPPAIIIAVTGTEVQEVEEWFRLRFRPKNDGLIVVGH